MANMTDFKVRRGLSYELFNNGLLNDNVVLELGCWYLCTDTAELFLCTDAEARALKRINDTHDHVTVVNIELDPTGNILLCYSDNSCEVIDIVGVINNIVDKADYATTNFVKTEIARAQIPGAEVDLSNYATKDYAIGLLSVLDGGDV